MSTTAAPSPAVGALEAPGDIQDLGDLIALVQAHPDLWVPKLYGQIRLDSGGPGASIGEPILCDDADVEDVEREIVRRLRGPCDVLVRARARGTSRAVTRYVRVTLGEAAARSYLEALAAPVPVAAAPAASQSHEDSALRAELAATRAKLDALTSGPAAAPSAWDLALKLGELQDRAFDRGRALASPSTAGGAPPELYQRLGRLEALDEARRNAPPVSSGDGGLATVVVAALPQLVPMVGDLVAAWRAASDARAAEAEARLAATIANAGQGAALRLVPQPAPPAPQPAPAAPPADDAGTA